MRRIKINGKFYRFVKRKRKPLKGVLDEYVVWTTKLTKEKIIELYKQTNPPFYFTN